MKPASNAERFRRWWCERLATQFGAPGRFVAGVLGADEEVLANGLIDGDRVLGDVGGQGAVGQVEVLIRAGVHHGDQFGGGYH